MELRLILVFKRINKNNCLIKNILLDYNVVAKQCSFTPLHKRRSSLLSYLLKYLAERVELFHL